MKYLFSLNLKFDIINYCSIINIVYLIFSVSESDEMTGSHKSERKSAAPITVAKVSKKKPQVEKWSRQDNKHTFSHEWLLTSLKGHTASILDLDFSANGKFLATCAEGKMSL